MTLAQRKALTLPIVGNFPDETFDWRFRAKQKVLKKLEQKESSTMSLLNIMRLFS